MPPPRKFLAPALAVVFPLLAWTFYRSNPLNSPLSVFHLAITRLLASQHLFHFDVLPQGEDIGWAEYFPGRDYLFHLLSALAYRAGGEAAARLLGPIFLTGAGVALYWLALLVLEPIAACACAVAALFAAPWVLPLLQFGPDALSVCLFLLLVSAVLRRRLILASVMAGISGLAGPSIYPALLGVILAALVAARDRTSRSAEMLGGTLFLLLCATLVNPYFPTNTEFTWAGLGFPLTIALLPFAAAYLRITKSIFIAAACAQIAFLHWFTFERGILPAVLAVRTAVALIPPGAAKIFNCETLTGSYLLYMRPDLRFVDAADPDALEEMRPGAAQFRRDLEGGAITDPRRGMQNVFGASYALCLNSAVNAQLDHDPAFSRIAENLYQIQLAPPPAFTRALEFHLAGKGDWVPYALADFQSALSFRDVRKPGVNCVRVRVPPSEMARFRGAEYIGLGGGAGIEAWRNGKQIYSMVGHEFLRSASLQALISLKPALTLKDKIEATFCSGPTRPYWSATISFWHHGICSRIPLLCLRK